MKKAIRAVTILIMSLLVCPLGLMAETGFPDSPVGIRAAEIFALLSGTSDVSGEDYVNENFAPAFRDAFPMEMHLGLFNRIRENYGEIRLVSIQEPVPNQILMVIGNLQGDKHLRLTINVEPNEPHRISSMGAMPIPPPGDSYNEDDSEPWDAYERGDFEAAEKYFATAADEDPSDFEAVLGVGRLALYRNDFPAAEKWLKKALELGSDDKEVAILLGEVYYRQNRYPEAAKYFRQAEAIARAEKLEFFGDRTPYLISHMPEVTHVDFVHTDPLPVIKLRINGKEALFLIDTGGWELTVEEEFGLEQGAIKLGEQIATYAGGLQGLTYHGFVDSVHIDDILIRNVPVVLKPGGNRIGQAMGIPIKGVVGTCFLYQFVFTLDYPNGRLTLRPPEIRYEAPADVAATTVPIRMAGDHIIVAAGKVNGTGPYLWFLDTGLAGGGFLPSDRLAKEAGLEIPEPTGEGVGGAGAVQIRRGTVDEVTLGEAVQKDVTAFFSVLPPVTRDRYGFRYAGIASHGFLKPYTVTFDIDRMTVTLEGPYDEQ